LKFPFGDLGFLPRDFGAVLCLFVRAQDAREVFESSASLLGLHESATLGAESVQLGGYFLGKERRNLIDGILFLSGRLFLALSLRSPNMRPRWLLQSYREFPWTRVVYL
jgi:hypothetical protein